MLFCSLPQLYYPTSSPLINTLNGLQPTPANIAAVQQVASSQHQQQYIDYATLAAVAAAGGQNTFAIHPSGSPLYLLNSKYQNLMVGWKGEEGGGGYGSKWVRVVELSLDASGHRMLPCCSKSNGASQKQRWCLRKCVSRVSTTYIRSLI